MIRRCARSSRRASLGRRAVGILALSLAAACGSREVVVGDGDHRYTWHEDWAQLPDGVELGYTHGRIVIDSAGRVYISSESEHSIFVFAADGTFLRSFGPEYAGGVHGMALAGGARGERLYLAHARRGEVLEVSLEGELLRTIGRPVESGLYPERKPYRPTSVAVAPDGSLFVADGYGLSYVHRFDAEHEYVASFGGRGQDARRLQNPHGLWIDETPAGETVLFVCDRENRRVQLFDFDGELLESWTEGIRRPCFLQRRGELFALADIDGKVTLLDRSGALLAHLGENPDPDGRDRRDVPANLLTPGVFVSPHGLCFGPDGSLFVVEWLDHGRITKLVPRR